MKRREFFTLLGSAAAAWPMAARGQQTGKVFRIGVIGPSLGSPSPASNFQSFLARLRELGFNQGQNVVIEHRAVDDSRGPFVAAAELTRMQPDLIVANGPEVALQAVLVASAFIPIVMIAINYDPIAHGYVSSLARPGGNITGVIFQQIELAQKQVELLVEAFPERGRLAVLWDALTADQFQAAERTAKSLNVQLQSLKLENPPYDVDSALQKAQAAGSQAVLVLSSPFFISHGPRIAERAIAYRLPTMFISKIYVQQGGLMSYGADFALMHRLAADYVSKILKGEKPSDLPIELAAKFDMVVNLKTAKAISVDLPTSILLRADEVIE